MFMHFVAVVFEIAAATFEKTEAPFGKKRPPNFYKSHAYGKMLFLWRSWLPFLHIYALLCINMQF
jgi:hypothetical protein